ncbi:hypothetical protein [Riemerella columbina]|uniref:hypothetical protein n=1 Tax=Riemerella columbina TaxID=103810 RepID=UPI00036667B8|nr:hypothetical protein [Riemerella columbina]
MLRELINYTESLSEEFKSLGLMPKSGLHILVSLKDNGELNMQSDSISFDYYHKKREELSPLLEQCMRLQENAWCVNTNKCFDLPIKAIHTCSPYCIGFKKEHLREGAKYIANEEKNKPQIYERFEEKYFDNAINLVSEDERLQRAFSSFKDFMVKGSWEVVLEDILNVRQTKYQHFEHKLDGLQNDLKATNDKQEKMRLKEEIKSLQYQMMEVQPLDEGDYILFYLDLPLDSYQSAHDRYLADKLFNTSDYNTEPNDEGLIYGTNDFLNGFNSNMPFLMHQTATFDITGRISNKDAKTLYELSKVMPRKTLPNPLPIFIYNDEFKKRVFAFYKEERLNFRDLAKTFYQDYSEDFQNYYLLQWANTQNGIVFNDFDFVAKFNYYLTDDKNGLNISNYFEIKEKGGKDFMRYPFLKTVFDLEDKVLKYLIQNKYHRVDYFSDFKKEDYENRDLTFLSYSKYRKAVYDFVYKSDRKTIGVKEFTEMVFNGILDDLKNNNGYGIKEKLNLWYSLYEFFDKTDKNKPTMANKLKEYQNFIGDLINDRVDAEKVTDEQFAFAVGQVIYYLTSKSKSDDTSYRLIDPYLQKTNCSALQQRITEDFQRYSHENFSEKFRKVSALVLTHDTSINMKDLQPQILSGVFAKNQLFSNSDKTNENS